MLGEITVFPPGKTVHDGRTAQHGTRQRSQCDGSVKLSVTGAGSAMEDVGEGEVTVLGAVLAAGAGRRFGGPKILAHQGEWLLKAVSALNAGGCGEVVVAMGAAVVPPPFGARALTVDDWATGLSATVRRVLGSVRESPGCTGVVLHVVDTPDVGSEVVGRVLAASGLSPAALVRSCFGGVPGHPVYIGIDHIDGVCALLSGDRGAGAYLAAHCDDVVAVECGDLAGGRDIDSPD